MKISEVIKKIKNYHRGINMNGSLINDETTRDKVLYGNANQECTGIITTCFASVDVIVKAASQGANLIVCHEALFWNHGDYIDWLNDNNTFNLKKQLLDKTGIVVFRNHDYVHSGIPYNGGWTDGIFYGFAKEVGWEKYITSDISKPMTFEIPEIRVSDLVEFLIDKFDLHGMRIVGDKNALVKKIWIAGHVMGGDNDKITKIDSEDIDCVIALELIDYTMSEYIRDSAQLKKSKAIISMGHFNLEEPGMEYMVTYLQKLFDIPVSFIKSGDSYSYIVKK